MANSSRPLVLFDGVCNLCNGAVTWLIERDRRERLTFASLQSEVARRALREAGAQAPLPDSIVFIDKAGAHTRSNAALRIVAALGFPWSLASALRIVPRPVRDWVYSWIASNRYEWFGRRDSCMIPSPELRARFLDGDEPQPPVALQPKASPGATDSAMATRPSSAETAAPDAGTIVARFLLRFILVYWIIFNFPFPLASLPYTGWLFGPYDKALNAVVIRVGAVVFHTQITVLPNGSGDTTFNYVEAFIDLALAFGAALAWTIARRSRSVSPRFVDLVRTYVRYALGITMLSYGWDKVFPLQFPMPGPDRLMMTYGDSSPMGLLWTFMGASTPYQIFAGMGEVIAGTLLLFRRTALLGALVAVGVLLNIVMLNFCYDVPVKLFSSNLLLMAIFLMAPHCARLAAILFLNLPAQPVALRPFPIKSAAMRWMRLAVKTAFVFWLAVYPTYQSFQMLYTTYGPLAPRQPWDGVYRVESFKRGSATDRALPDRERWVRVGLDSYGVGAIQRADGSARRQLMEIDPEKHMLTITRHGDPSPIVLSFNQPGPDELVIEGNFEGLPTIARLKREKDALPLLTTRGFHWINEYPMNR